VGREVGVEGRGEMAWHPQPLLTQRPIRIIRQGILDSTRARQLG
jgi:hypothetical protein